jgi:hypothetical protein
MEKFTLAYWHTCTVIMYHIAAKSPVDFQRFTDCGNYSHPFRHPASRAALQEWQLGLVRSKTCPVTSVVVKSKK